MTEISEGMRKEIYDYSESSKKEAEEKAKAFSSHPAAVHFKKAAHHYAKAMKAATDSGDDNDSVRHVERADRVFEKGLRMVNNSVEDPEGNQLDENRFHVVVKRYNKDEDEVLSKHSSIGAAGRKLATAIKSNRDVHRAVVKDTQTGKEYSRTQAKAIHSLGATPSRLSVGITKEEVEEYFAIVDAVATQDEVHTDPFFARMETKCNALVDTMKEEIQLRLFSKGK